jgi:hypothetical protein
VDVEGVSAGAGVDALGPVRRDGDGAGEPDVEGSNEPGAPIRTRSVLLRRLGVPARELGRSSSPLVRGVGSALFCVISSRKASASAASPGLVVGVAVDEDLLPPPPLALGGAKASRSSRNCWASWALDMALMVENVESPSQVWR